MPDIVYDEERIIDKPEVQEANDNDYVLIDSVEDGMRCIKVENLKGGAV